jgi:hypothetical protein
MIAALKDFQRQQQTGAVDGRVDPGGPVLAKLEELHIRGLSANDISSLPGLVTRPGMPWTGLPPGVTPEVLFREYLDTLRNALG